MAVLKLQVGDTTGTSVDLLSGDIYNVELQAAGWTTRSISVRDEGQTWETMPLIIRASADGTVRAAINKIMKIIEIGRNYNKADGFSSDEIAWLYWSTSGETGRRAMIYDGALDVGSVGKFTPLLGNSGKVFASLAVLRGNWESTTASTGNTTGVNCLGGKVSVSTLSGSSISGRFADIALAPTSATYYFKGWIGYRPTFGGTANFQTVFNINNAGSADTTSTTDSTAYNNDAMVCDFSSGSSMRNRAYYVNTLTTGTTGSGTHTAGRYLALLRAKSTSGSSIALRMGYGYPYAQATLLATVYHIGSNGQYQLIPMGEIQMPATGRKYDQVATRTYLYVDAEKLTTGAASLYMDCFVLIPSPYTGFFTGREFQNVNRVRFKNLPNEERQVFFGLTSTEITSEMEGTHNIEAQVDGSDAGVLVVAIQREDLQVTTDTINVTYQLYPRFGNYDTT